MFLQSPVAVEAQRIKQVWNLRACSAAETAKTLACQFSLAQSPFFESDRQALNVFRSRSFANEVQEAT